MFNQAGLIKAVMDAGASGYILKDDLATLQKIGEVITTVAQGGIHLSKVAYQKLFNKLPQDSQLTQRQSEVLSLCAAYPEETSAALAARLGVENSTLRNLLSNAYLQLGVRTRLAAISKARTLGLITPNEDYVEF
jgi:DNA-binding NarL/FixJ family response regulator